ncbi:MAG: branched-chain amino acid ABC transporter permease [Mesorhizobium sp.]
MDFAIVVLVEILHSIAVLVLISSGLAVIFGMMRVINLAHGEFLTLGGYVAILGHRNGLNLYFCMLVLAPVVVGLWGLIVERLVVRWLYGRLINTMLATWGLSLAMTGAFSMIFGNTMTGIPNPLGGLTVGDYQISGYSLFLIGAAAAVMAVITIVLKATRAGLIARGAMQRPDMAQAFGLNISHVYMTTFAAGAALSGLAGALLAPLVGLSPGSGANYIAKAFITVISGGASVVTGTIVSAGLFGSISQVFTLVTSSVGGEIALLVAAVVLLRLMPIGITGRFFKGWT